MRGKEWELASSDSSPEQTQHCQNNYNSSIKGHWLIGHQNKNNNNEKKIEMLQELPKCYT